MTQASCDSGPRQNAADAAEKRRLEAENDPAEQERKKQRLLDASRDRLVDLQGAVAGRFKAFNRPIPVNLYKLPYEKLVEMYASLCPKGFSISSDHDSTAAASVPVHAASIHATEPVFREATKEEILAKQKALDASTAVEEIECDAPPRKMSHVASPTGACSSASSATPSASAIEEVSASSSTCLPVSTHALASFHPLQGHGLEKKPRPFRNTMNAGWKGKNSGSCFVNAALQAMFGSPRIQSAIVAHLSTYYPADDELSRRISALWRVASGAQTGLVEDMAKSHDRRPERKESTASMLRQQRQNVVTDEDVLALTYAAAMQHARGTNQGTWLLPSLTLRRFYTGDQDDSSKIVCEFLETCSFLKPLVTGHSKPHRICCLSCGHVMRGHCNVDDMSWSTLRIHGESPNGDQKYSTMQEALNASLERADRPEGFTREGQGCSNPLCRSLHGFEIRPGELVDTPLVLTVLLEGWKRQPNGAWMMLHTDLANVLEVKVQGREYRLRSVTLHGQGNSPMCGHYVALACHGVPEKWYLYNDDIRVEVDVADLRSHFKSSRLFGVFRANAFIYEAVSDGVRSSSAPGTGTVSILPASTSSSST